MPKHKLSHLTAANLVKAGKKGRTGDGEGLWLDVRAPGRAAWVFRYTLRGGSHEIGLGGYSDVSLANARDKAAASRALVGAGTDPIAHKAAEAQARIAADAAAKAEASAGMVTFKIAAESRIAAKEAEYRNAKHRQQWRNSLVSYVYPVFGDKPVNDVDRDDVLRALQPIWLTKPETATRVRQRIEVVLDYAGTRNWRSGANPAIWRGNLSHLLPSTKKTVRVRHHPALPWSLLPSMMAALKEVPGMGALALRFAILTAARSGEVRGATWGEINIDGAVWTIAAARMKAGREHRVPLSAEALSVLAQVRSLRVSENKDALVFPGSKLGRSLSDMTLAAVIKRLNQGGEPTWVDESGEAVVPHGFRSCFRDWCSDTRPEPSEVVEKALAHAITNAVEAAYRRGDLFDRRATLMEAWGQFCSAQAPSNVTTLRQASG